VSTSWTQRVHYLQPNPYWNGLNITWNVGSQCQRDLDYHRLPGQYCRRQVSFKKHPRENDISRMLLTKYHWYIYIIYIYIYIYILALQPCWQSGPTRSHGLHRVKDATRFSRRSTRGSTHNLVQRLTKNPMKKDSMWKNRHRNTYFIIFHHHIYTYVIFVIYLIYLNLHHYHGDLGRRAARWQALDGAKALFSPAVQRFAWRSSRTMECWQDMTGATQKNIKCWEELCRMRKVTCRFLETAVSVEGQ
jgi:hypothetical protein